MRGESRVYVEEGDVRVGLGNVPRPFKWGGVVGGRGGFGTVTFPDPPYHIPGKGWSAIPLVGEGVQKINKFNKNVFTEKI